MIFVAVSADSPRKITSSRDYINMAQPWTTMIRDLAG
jgi:hypothetical protein